MAPGTDFFLLLVPIAFLYAAVGHGGASGYLALMALYGFAPAYMKPAALLLNIFVSLAAFVTYFRGGYFRGSLFLPLALSSVPAAYAGGMLVLPAETYRIILGIFLVIAAARFFMPAHPDSAMTRPVNTLIVIGVGGVIGFLSGTIGIGGGILLSPLLILLRWADVRQSAAVSALFITVNSIAGLTGQLQQGADLEGDMFFMTGLALGGGIAGAHFGAFRFSLKLLRALLGLVLLLAAGKLLFF